MGLWDRLLKLFGTNRTRLAWKTRAWKAGWQRRKARTANRAAAVTYAHKTCPNCSHPADRADAVCSRCGARLGGMVAHRSRRAAQALGLDAPVATIALLVGFAAIYMACMTWSRQHPTPGPGTGTGPGGLALLTFGAGYGPSIRSGEPWRLVTYAFLHGDLLHLAMNGLSLWSVGKLLEARIGSTRVFTVFLLTSVLAALGSLAWHEEVRGGVMFTVGASGGLCGLIGVVVGMALRPGNAMRHLRPQYVQWAIMIGIMSFMPRVDGAAHAAGFAAGAGLGALMRVPDPRARWAPRLWGAAAALSLGAVVATFVMARQAAGTDASRLAMAAVDGDAVRKMRADLAAEFTEVQPAMAEAPRRERALAGVEWLRAFATLGGDLRPHQAALAALWRDVMAEANGSAAMVISEPALDELARFGQRLGVPADEVAAARKAARLRVPAPAAEVEAPATGSGSAIPSAAAPSPSPPAP